MPADLIPPLNPLRSPEWVQRIDRLLHGTARNSQGAVAGGNTVPAREAPLTQALQQALDQAADLPAGHGSLYEGLFAAPLSPMQADALDHFMQALIRVTRADIPPPALPRHEAGAGSDSQSAPARADATSQAPRDAFSQALKALVLEMESAPASAALRQAFARLAPALADLMPAPALPPGMILPPALPLPRKRSVVRDTSGQAAFQPEDADLLALLIRVQQALQDDTDAAAEHGPGRLIDLRA